MTKWIVGLAGCVVVSWVLWSARAPETPKATPRPDPAPASAFRATNWDEQEGNAPVRTVRAEPALPGLEGVEIAVSR